MEAMILAAGLGTRLRPLTDRVPKALLEVGGIAVLERVARRLIEAGAHRLIINLHHEADAIERFVANRGGFGVEVALSREEPGPLETGGGLAHARALFEASAPFFLHNVDVLTELDLEDVYRSHLAGESSGEAIATVVVARRSTSRPLLVDREGVCGRANRSEGWERLARDPRGSASEVGFQGIHVLSPRIFPRLDETGAFSIVDSYMRLIEEGARVAAYDATGVEWHDIGTPERLRLARTAFEGRAVSRLRGPGAGG